MKKLIYIFLITLCCLLSPATSFAQTTTGGQPIYKYLGKIKTPAEEAALRCEVTTPTQYWSVTEQRFKFCSGKNTFSTLGESASAAVNLSKFAASLPTAIATLGTNKTILIVSQNTTVSTALVIPANVTLKQENDAKIIKAASGTVNCQGNCLADAMADTPFFSGFAVGDITFTGANYPRSISTAIFDNANASTRINLADRALLGKPAEIYATAGHLGERVIINENHSLKFAIGEFTNDVGVAFFATFQLHSNTRITGAGIGLTIVRESSSDIFGANGLFYAESVQISGANGTNQNITISDLTILGASNVKPVDQQNSAISLGNVENGRIERVHIKGVHGFGAYVGGNGETGNYSKNSYIVNNIFENVGTQNTGSTNSDGLVISGNQFTGGNTVETGYSYYIDCETNGQGRMENITISNNILKGAGAFLPLRELYGIAVNGAGIRRAHSIIITGNILQGFPIGDNPDNGDGFTIGITLDGVEDVTITGNKLGGIKNVGISVRDGAALYINNNTLNAVGNFNGIPAMLLRGVTNSIIRNNDFPIIRTNSGSQTSATSNSNFGSSKLISEVGTTAESAVATVGGITTVTVTQGDRNVFEWWKGKVINLAAAAGITAGNYTVSEVNFAAKTLTLATAAGNGNTVLTTLLSNNIYIDNIDAQYSLPAGSRSFDNLSGNRKNKNTVIASIPSAQLNNIDSGLSVLCYNSTIILPATPENGVFFTITVNPAIGCTVNFPNKFIVDNTGEAGNTPTSRYVITNGSVTFEWIGVEWVVTSKYGTSAFAP